MNSLLYNCVTSWNVPPAIKSELETADAILAFSLGYREFSASPSNIELARVADRLCDQYHIPIMAQHEVADCLVTKPMVTIRRHRVARQYLDTFEVGAQYNDHCIRLGFKTVIVVAHPHHQWRAMCMTSRLGLTPLAADCQSVPYDPKSIQWWTRNSLLFGAREVPHRLLCAWEGKL
jgi:hypothetical protein